jgi:hypothetical protein
MHGGLPMPAVIATRKGHIEIVPSAWAIGTHMTAWVPECDEPDFGKYDEEKLRRCIHGRYCHVCTRKADPLLICVPKVRAITESQHIEVGGRVVPMVVQPWVCAECLKYAAHACPPLRKAIDEKRGVVAFVDEAQLVVTYWKPADPKDPTPPPGATVISFLKVALVHARYMPLPEWVRRFA